MILPQSVLEHLEGARRRTERQQVEAQVTDDLCPSELLYIDPRAYFLPLDVYPCCESPRWSSPLTDLHVAAPALFANFNAPDPRQRGTTGSAREKLGDYEVRPSLRSSKSNDNQSGSGTGRTVVLSY